MNENEFEEVETLNLRIFLIALGLTIFSFLFITLIVPYEKYYYNKGTIYKDNNEFYIKMYVDIDDIKTILDNSTIIIDGEEYDYYVYYIQNNLYVNESYNNYQELMIKTTLKYPIENRVVTFSIKIGDEKLIDFIIESIKGGK